MANSATSIFDIIASQFADNANKASYIAWSRAQTSKETYGVAYERAIALRAAHMMTLDNDLARVAGGSGGNISSKKEGDLSISFDGSVTAGDRNADLKQTHYGVQLLGLRRGAVTAIAATGGIDNPAGTDYLGIRSGRAGYPRHYNY